MILVAYTWDFSAAWNAMPTLLQGAKLTILLTLVVMALSLPFGLILALLRLVRFKPLNILAYVYTELLRTTPVLVVITWFYVVVPMTFGIQMDVFVMGVVALSLNVTAFIAEIVRGSILSIDPGQREAALSTGMSEWSAMRRIILPQAILRAIPLLAATFISLFKDTSLVAVIGVQDLMFEARGIAVETYRPMEVLTVAALMYFLLTYPQSLLVNYLFERFRVIE